MTTTLIVVVIILLIAVGVLGFIVLKHQKSERLKKQFGPEYDRRLAETNDRKSVEDDLQALNKRHNELKIHELDPEEREKFQNSWGDVQATFVDDPRRAVIDADRLVNGIMRARGYPVEDFDQRADDISVEHADVVRHYREARTVRDASSKSSDSGQVDTEAQRHAVTAYRALVESLLGHHSDRAQHSNSTATSSANADSSTKEHS